MEKDILTQKLQYLPKLKNTKKNNNDFSFKIVNNPNF